MNEFEAIEAKAKSFGFKRVVRWSAISAAALVIFWVVFSVLGVFGTVATTGTRVINKTLDADNVISTYERFHDRWKAFESRKAQIRSHTSVQGETSDERASLRMEVQAMRQSCRDIAANYNADSAKINRNIFKGKSAPAELSMGDCDV